MRGNTNVVNSFYKINSSEKSSLNICKQEIYSSNQIKSVEIVEPKASLTDIMKSDPWNQHHGGIGAYYGTERHCTHFFHLCKKYHVKGVSLSPYTRLRSTTEKF